MNGFLKFFLVLFVLVFILQKSNFVEKKTVVDSRFGGTRDEYNFNPDNLGKYICSIPEKIMNIPNTLKGENPLKK